MTEAINIIKVVTRLRDLSQDPNSQPIIVRRGVLPSIVTFLANDNFDVKLIATQTINFLASHPDNRALMVQEKNLLPNVHDVYKCCEHKRSPVEESMYKLTREVLSYLCEHISEEIAKTLPDGFSKMMSNCGLQFGRSGLRHQHKNSHAGDFELQKKHNLIIVVDELKSGEQVRSQLQKLVLATPGTISYTINVSNNRITLYTRTPTEKLLEVFAKNGLTRTTVVMDAICETEFRKPAGSGEAGQGMDKENDEPEYLSPETNTDSSTYKKSLVAFGQADTLEQRLAKRKKRQQQKDRQQKEESGFLTKITSLRFW